MYFPYLRGRQFELIALRELIEKGVLSKNITSYTLNSLNATRVAFKTGEQAYFLLRSNKSRHKPVEVDCIVRSGLRFRRLSPSTKYYSLLA